MARQWRDLTGEKFNMLTVIERDPQDYIYPRSGRHEPRWICECSCPEHNRISVIQHNLLNGHAYSCGCANKNSFKDITGQTFGYLTVIERAEDYITPKGDREVQWLCECNSPYHKNPVKTIVRGAQLRSGHTKSCGCLIVATATIHGLKNHPLYNTLNRMKRRCYNKNDDSYKDYGGRGIYVCDEWMEPNGVGMQNFYNWAMSTVNDPEHGYRADRSIGRIDNDGPYAPWNCRWENQKEQSNNRRSNRIMEYNNESHTISEWSDITGISSYNIYNRLDMGWSPEKTLETPLNGYIKQVEIDGKLYTLEQLSSISGFSSNLLYDRIYRQGWDPKQAISTPIRTRTITHNNDTFAYAEWERALGYSEGVISKRIRRGWTEEEALLGKKSTNVQPCNAIYFIDEETGKPIAQNEYDEYLNNK